MMDNIFIPFLAQLLGQAPVLLVYLAGMVLALVFWRRCPRPAMLTLIGMALFLVTTLVQSFLFIYLVRARDDFGWSHEMLGWIVSASGLIGSVIRAAAFGLMLTAVFIGRKERWQTTANEELQLTGPASRQSEEHGITSRPGR